MVATFLIGKGGGINIFDCDRYAFRCIAMKKNDKIHTNICSFKKKTYLCSS